MAGPAGDFNNVLKHTRGDAVRELSAGTLSTTLEEAADGAATAASDLARGGGGQA